MNIIGFLGRAGSGKDTAADLLVKRGWVKVALADPIKRAAAEWWGFTEEQLWGPSEKREEIPDRFRSMPEPWGSLTPRRALQILGTEIGRQIYADTWIDLALHAAEKLLGGMSHKIVSGDQEADGLFLPRYLPYAGLFWIPLDADDLDDVRPCRGVVISDVRFSNEVAAINAAGGRVVKLVGRGGLSGEASAHASEAEQYGIDDSAFAAVIDNSGTKEALEMALERLVSNAAHSATVGGKTGS